MLLDKLRSDYELLAAEPINDKKAFDFFVTAESLLDWCAPGFKNKSLRKQMRSDDVLLQVLSHIASNAKHHEAEDARHKSVTASRKVSSLFGGRLYSGALFHGQIFSKGNLVVELNGPARAELGDSITAVELAKKVLVRMQELVVKYELAQNDI